MNIAAEIAAARGRAAEAESLYREVAGSASEDPGPALNARAGLASLYASRGQNKRARAEYAATIALAEAQRDRPLDDRFKLPWSSSLTRFYRGYVEFLIARGDLSGALAVADSTRSRMLLNSGHPPLATAASYRDIARRAQSVILAYWLAPERSYLWEITSDGIRLHTLPGSSSIRALVAAHNGAIAGSRNPLEIEAAAGQRLWDVLISPAAATIARIPRVILVPDGPICSLNLESLPVPGSHPHYFVEDASITVAPALWLLRPARSLPSAHASLLLAGDPEPSGPEFPRLTYAKQEIEQIEQHFNGMQQVVLQGAAATRDAWLGAGPGKYSMLHFAGHAASNPISPLQSALVLSPGAGGHLLTAADVMNLHLNANLVTISACRGAGSRIYSGEGLVGLTWSFLRAGARGVIAGLWDVPDRPTAMLMGSLYQRLAAGERPQEALRDAKLAMLRSGPASSKPNNWAAFQYYSSTY
ncbi:MAG TPA: CHAT domain-containing protein [Bryobacteraceae bacterium]|nr:CHAT domain-containing protein [Bryobacteraceae bacterium]